MVIKAIVIKKSKINGKGVFANRNFEKGEVVFNWFKCSREITKEAFQSLSNDEKKYVSELNNRYFLFLDDARYLNHSCNPNTELKDFSDIASRIIKKGEEITCNYFKQDASSEFKCNCGSKNCKTNVSKNKK